MAEAEDGFLSPGKGGSLRPQEGTEACGTKEPVGLQSQLPVSSQPGVPLSSFRDKQDPPSSRL